MCLMKKRNGKLLMQMSARNCIFICVNLFQIHCQYFCQLGISFRPGVFSGLPQSFWMLLRFGFKYTLFFPICMVAKCSHLFDSFVCYS